MSYYRDMTPYSLASNFQVTFPEPHVAQIELSCPKGRRAFLEQMCDELKELFTYLSHEPSVHVIVLSTSGDAGFSTGFSIPDIKPKDRANELKVASRLASCIASTQDCISAIETCNKRKLEASKSSNENEQIADIIPAQAVINVVHGLCRGLGLEVACASDIRICSSSTRFSLKEGSDAGILGGFGAMRSLLRIVNNSSLISEVTMSARDFSSDEAFRIGLVSDVWRSRKEAIAESFKLAETIGSRDENEVQMAKQSMQRQRESYNITGQASSSWRSEYYYSDAEVEADLDQALGVGSLAKTQPLERL